LLDLKTKVIS